MEKSLQNGCLVSSKTVHGDKTSTIVQRQCLELVTIVIAINVVIGEFSGEDFK